MKTMFVGALLMFASFGSAVAGPGYYLVSVYENEGEKTVDFKSWTVNVPGSAAIIAPEVGLGYGVTKQWYSELSTTYLRTTSENYGAYPETNSTTTRPLSWNWQNDLLLTHGQYPFDLAIHTNVDRFHDTSTGVAFEFGPVLQTEYGKIQFNANLFFERNYRADFSNRMQMKYQWQAKYRWRPTLQFGVQGFGEVGEWDDWASRDQQSHRIGPIISGEFAMGDAQALKYDIAYLTGSIYAQHARVFSMRVQYAF